MNRKRGMTKKKYDYSISPHNEPQINLKRLLHFLSCLWLVINCIVLARLLPDRRLHLVFLAFVFIFMPSYNKSIRAEETGLGGV